MPRIDVLTDVRFIQVDQLMTVPLRTIQQWTHLFNKRRSPFRTGTAQ